MRAEGESRPLREAAIRLIQTIAIIVGILGVLIFGSAYANGGWDQLECSRANIASLIFEGTTDGCARLHERRQRDA